LTQKLSIIWNDLFLQAASLSASSAQDNFPAVNLKDRQRTRTWRSMDLTNEYIFVDFGSSIYCTCLALINHNLTFSGKITVQASDNANFSSMLKNNEDDAWADIIGYGERGYGEHGYGGLILEAERAYYAPSPIRIIYFDPVNGDHVKARYWLIRLADATNGAGYFELGRLFLGTFDHYAKQFGYGWEYGGEDDSTISTSVSGQDWIDRRPVRRTLRLNWNTFNNEDKYWRFLFFLKQVGKSKEFVIDPVPEGKPSERFFTTMYGRFTDIPKIAAANPKSSELELEFKESL
jgi:hypothetical protein